MYPAPGSSADAPEIARANRGTGSHPPRYAPWSRRVLAVLLDAAIMAAVVFLAGGVAETPSILPGLDLPAVDSLAGPPSWWGACTLGAFLLVQAYTGWTPGKRVVGIAVVDATTLRPIRLGRTLLRWLAHVLDAILLIGYLRPLWEPQRRTFADGLLRSVVLETRSPEGDPTSGAAFARVITPAASALCAAGVLLSVGVSSTTADSSGVACEAVHPDAGSLTVTRGESTVRETRLWISRDAPRTHSLEATWEGGATRPPATLELTASSRDGSATRTVTATGETVLLDLPDAELKDLGDDFTYRAAVVEDGADLMVCEG